MGKEMFNILIIEDEEGIAESMGLLFEDFGWSYQVAGSGEEAIAVLNKKRFNLAIVDLRLPGMDGIDFILNTYHKFTDLIYILFTGSIEINLSEIEHLDRVRKKVFFKPLKDTLELIEEIKKCSDG